MLVLDIYIGAQRVRADIPVHGRLAIGRDPCSSVIIPDGSVSRRHASLVADYSGEEPVVTLRDEGSTNGTYVNGKLVVSQDVSPSDTIFLGRCRLRLRVGTAALLPGVRNDHGQTIVFTGNPFEESSRSSQRLEALHGLSQGLHELDIPAILDKAYAAAKRCLTFDSFCVALVDSGSLRVINAWNRSGACSASEISVSQTIVEACLRDAQPVISGNIRNDQRFRGVDSVAIKRLSRAMCVPLLGEDGTLGVLYCSSQSPKNTYSNSDLQFLMLIASDVAVALRHDRSLSRTQVEADKRGVVLDSLQEAVLFCDEQFRVVSANHAASELFHAEALVGHRLEKVLAAAGFSHDFDPTATVVHKAFYIERRAHGVSSYGVERLQSFQATLSRISGLEEDGWQHIVCLRDVSNVQRSEKMREIFAYQLAHKLNTPLTIVLSTATFIEEKIQSLCERLGEELDQESRSSLDMGRKNLAEMNALVERFVQLSGTEVGKAGIEAHHEVVKLSSLISQALDFASSDIHERGLTVVDGTREEKRSLVVNVEKITDCFLQIIQNAAKFAGAGATLSVNCHADDTGVHVSFTDDGPGIPDTQQEEVFEIFHQIDVDDTGAVPGLGLGLWWSREVFQVHGGDVKIISPVAGGRGTCIEMSFPSTRVVEPDNDTAFHDVGLHLADSTGSLCSPDLDLDLDLDLA